MTSCLVIINLDAGCLSLMYFPIASIWKKTVLNKHFERLRKDLIVCRATYLIWPNIQLMFSRCSLPEFAVCSVIEAFQGVWATSDIASKCGDNLLPRYRQPTEADMKGATICENDNPFFISTKRQLHFFSSTATWLSWLRGTQRPNLSKDVRSI